MNKERLTKGMLAMLAGSAIIYYGDHLLGVQIELWYGLDTFSFWWMLDMFLLPFISGLAVSMIFGMGGKWLSYFPPLLVRLANYYVLLHSTLPADTILMRLGYWGFFVILTMEAAGIGGIFGEIMIKGTYGRSARSAIYKGRSDENDEGDS
jgi:hypothetical protein